MRGSKDTYTPQDSLVVKTARRATILGAIVLCGALALVASGRTPRAPRVFRPSYPIPQQPGIWPPESPAIPVPFPPNGATAATAWAFLQNNIYDARAANIDVDYLAVKALVNGQTVTVVIDDYGTAAGQQAIVYGDWTPRSNYTDPSLEIPGPVADSWSTTYFTTNTAKDLAYGMQIWNGLPGAVPKGATKVWAEIRVRVNGSGLVCFGWDWYDANGNYITNAGYSGFQTYLAAGAQPTWLVVDLGK
jgi:hypothetical protein